MSKTMEAFIEGRGSMASLERAIADSNNPLMARAEMERELAAEWALKNLFATIPPPPVGLSKAMAALKSAPMPKLAPETEAALKQVNDSMRDTMASIPEPAGGYQSALARLKSKLAAAPDPKLASHDEIESDIRPGCDEMPAARLSEVPQRKRTNKIVRLPQRSSMLRDVLAAGKDLPENPNDIPDSDEKK